MTALIEAARKGNVTEVKQLIEAGVDVNETTEDSLGSTALMLAIRLKHIAVVELLLQQAKPDVNIADEDGDTALIWAAQRGLAAVVAQLIEAKTDVNAANQEGNTALILAIGVGHTAVAQLLLQTNVNVNLANKHGYTALIAAAANGLTGVVEQLLHKNANVHHIAAGRYTALKWAEAHKDTTMIELLKAKANTLNTALIEAAKNGNSAEIAQLIEAGADVNSADHAGSTALIWATMNGHTAAVKQLIEAHAAVNDANQDGDTALIWAAGWGRATIVEQLLQANADVNHTNKHGNTALMWATMGAHTAAVKQLIEANAKVDLDDNHYGFTALLWAASHGYSDIVEQLLQANADVRHRDYTLARTALVWAAINKHTDTIKQFLGPNLVSLNSSPDEFTSALERINKIAAQIKGDAYQDDRKILRDCLIECLNTNYNLLKNKTPEQLESYLDKLRTMKKHLDIVQPNKTEKKLGQEKAAMKTIKSMIEKVEALKPPKETSISHAILQLFDQPDKPQALIKLLPRLVEPNAAEINEIRKTIVALPADQRKNLREALEVLLDKTAIKNKNDLSDQDQWILTLHAKYQTEKDHIPFITILRVSSSGKKPNYNTDTYQYFISVMKTGAFKNAAASPTVTVQKQGFYAENKNKGEPDVTGQTVHRKLRKHILGNDKL